MRTTVTLDADTEQLLRARMRERQVSFKQALNDALREVLAAEPASAPFQTTVHSLGVPAINLDRALQVAAALEDEDLIARMRREG